MLRRIIGWICYSDDTWEERGRRMADKLRSCLEKYPIQDWSERINERKARVIEGINELPFWTKAAIEWDPRECDNLNVSNSSRKCGHPCERWSDGI